MYLLNTEEIQTFREEYQEREKEIQRYIGVYLSGLVLITGWIVGPQSTPIVKMVLGNEGYNVYGVMVIIALNVIFTCFLLYKSLLVHEINQFLTYQTGETGYRYWESWRRSKYSATRFARGLYSGLLAILPVAVSAILLVGLYQLFYTDPQSLVEQLARAEGKVAAGSESASLQSTLLDPAHLQRVLTKAFNWFYVVAGIHILPLLFLWLNWKPNDMRWERINKLRSGTVEYKDLDAVVLKKLPPTKSERIVEAKTSNKGPGPEEEKSKSTSPKT